MQTPKIAVLVDTATGWGRRIIRGVLDYAVENGPWNVWIAPKGQNENFEVPPDSDVEGVIARISTKEQVKDLKERNIPAVNVSGLLVEGCDFPRVTTDYTASARLAEAYFRDHALYNFAYVGPIHKPYVREHEQAFEKVLTESGTVCHVFNPGEKLGHNIPFEVTETHLIPWLKSLPKPIGIYTWGFRMGRDIINACRKAGIHVPHDVAVLGGDYDALLSDACHPALSGVIVPARQIGFCAASILNAMLKGEEPPEDTIFFEADKIEERLSTEILSIDDPQTLQAVTYLREHACEGIQVSDILRKVPMARRAMERRFMKILGRSPAQELRRVRIEQARKLLAQTNMPMQNIAEACGYSSYSYLGTVFKKETGISPCRYRNLARGSHPVQF